LIFWYVIYLQYRELVYESAKLLENVLQLLDKCGGGVLQWAKGDKENGK
jgi:hypothetical protein